VAAQEFKVCPGETPEEISGVTPGEASLAAIIDAQECRIYPG